jgi:acyl-CoA thioesterase-1
MRRMCKMSQLYLLFTILALCLPMSAAMALKVACVGDSHTYSGAWSNPDVSFPAQLETILKQMDSDWETRNFGVSGATVIEVGNLPYIHQADYTFPWRWCIDPNAYELALAYDPDVVVFQFGSNATMPKNWDFIEGHFLSDYNDLIQTFAQLPSQPKIVICQPPPMFDPMYSPCATLLKDEIVPMVAQLAATWNAPIVDFYTAFQDLRHLYKDDQMHVTAAGAKIMAEMIAEELKTLSVSNPDLNGDGIVDTTDMHIMVDSWGRNDPLCDIAPGTFGDGVVDIQDMTVLAEYMEPVDMRLITHWRLDETTSDIATDSATHYDGGLKGNPTWMPAGGIVGGALHLDGIDDYIEGPFILDPKQGPFSFCAWIKTSEHSQVIVSQAASYLDWLSIDSSGQLTTGLSFPMPSPLTSNLVIADDVWHHIALVTDGAGKCLYVDGLEAACDDQPIIMSSVNGLNIGTGQGLEPDSFFTGLIDDVRIYNQVLEPNDIAELVQ